MPKRDGYYDGEENDGLWLGFLFVVAVLVAALLCILSAATV